MAESVILAMLQACKTKLNIVKIHAHKIYYLCHKGFLYLKIASGTIVTSNVLFWIENSFFHAKVPFVSVCLKPSSYPIALTTQAVCVIFTEKIVKNAKIYHHNNYTIPKISKIWYMLHFIRHPVCLFTNDLEI